jgi:hypothetical protein
MLTVKGSVLDLLKLTITYWRIYYTHHTFSTVAAPQISAPLHRPPARWRKTSRHLDVAARPGQPTAANPRVGLVEGSLFSQEGSSCSEESSSCPDGGSRRPEWSSSCSAGGHSNSEGGNSCSEWGSSCPQGDSSCSRGGPSSVAKGLKFRPQSSKRAEKKFGGAGESQGPNFYPIYQKRGRTFFRSGSS